MFLQISRWRWVLLKPGCNWQNSSRSSSIPKPSPKTIHIPNRIATNIAGWGHDRVLENPFPDLLRFRIGSKNDPDRGRFLKYIKKNSFRHKNYQVIQK